MFLSLLGGMGASRPVETLTRTGGFGASVVNRRLLETTQHTLGVHDGLAAIQPGGAGWESSVRVRLLHAAVRQRIVALTRADPSYYDVAAYGVPVNDLDCIGTMNTFSATVLWLGLPRQGIRPRPQEIADYLALWRWVSHLMGTPHDWLATPAAAKAMMESLLVSEIAPSPKSGVLANNIITGFEGLGPTYASRGFMCAETYWLNGRQLARELNIAPPSFYQTALVAGQCLFFMISGYLCRSIPALDARNIKVSEWLSAPFHTVPLKRWTLFVFPLGAFSHPPSWVLLYLGIPGWLETQRAGCAVMPSSIPVPSKFRYSHDAPWQALALRGELSSTFMAKSLSEFWFTLTSHLSTACPLRTLRASGAQQVQRWAGLQVQVRL